MRKLYTLLATLFVAFSAFCQISPLVSLTAGTYQQDFNTLASSGTSSATPPGWGFLESGTNTNTTYTAGTGSGNTGDTYSFGASGSTERAFGGVRSGSLVPLIGAAFTNHSSQTITSLTVSYTGEQWRLGTANRGADRLDFQYSMNATALNNGIWTDVNELDFSSPVTAGTVGALNGNDADNRTVIIYTISGLSIPAGSTFYIRWTDFDAPNADDGLAIDDFSLSFSTDTNIPPSPTEIAVAGGADAAEPNTTGSFFINFSKPTTESTDLTFAFAGSATFGTDYTVSYSAGSTTSASSTGTLTIPSGTSSLTVTVTPTDDAIAEGTETISFTLSSPADGFTITTTSATINLSDNDLAEVSVSAGNHAAEPGTSGTFTINLSSVAPAGGVSISYTLTGTATPGTDYLDANTGTILIPEGSSSGVITLQVVDDHLFEGAETISITLTSAGSGFALSISKATISLLDNDIPKVVINQVYGGGGNSGATYTHDFIELYNNEEVAVNLQGWSVQYNSAGGTGTWQKTDLTKTIPARGFYLIQQARGSGGTTPLPAPDDAGSIGMSGTAGKVLLSNATTALSGANPSGVNVIDKVGYGGAATGFEGAPAPGTENETGVKRTADGVDSNDNSNDFVKTQPEPRNSVYTITPPAIVSLTPPDNSTDLPYNISTRISFDKPVQKGTGAITVYENGVPSVITVGAAAVTIDHKTATLNIGYTPGRAYSITIDAGAFKDAYGNPFAGISDNITWNFSTYNTANPVGLPVNFDFQNCTGTGLLPHGFTQFSATGDIVWDCTPFGRNPAEPKGTAQYPYAVQISGYANNTNIPNVDWLISPAFDLRGTTYPLLQFWSRTAFNGLPLQLKVSTDYPGTGDPRNYTWTNLNGKFPNQASNEWILSNNINLSAYKGARVHVAFVYTSTDDDGARWTIDDFSIIDSPTPPPPSLTLSTRDVQFNYVAGGSTGIKTFTLTGNDITNDILLNSTGAFQISKDGSNFSTSLRFTQQEANDKLLTVQVQFVPPAENQSFSGELTVNTSGLSSTVNLKGTSIDPATTLEVVNWNIEWFGHTGNGPANEALQEQNVLKILKSVDADVYALMEIVDEAKLKKVVEQLDGYEYVISDFGSHTNTAVNPASALAEAQKLAFVYKTSVVKNKGTRAVLSQGINTLEDARHPYYNYWSSGRFPFMMDADVTLGGITKNVKFILIHAKANTTPVDQSYQRRKAGADILHDSLRILFPTDNLVLLGDFNDDLDQSITAGFTTTSWDKFVNDKDEYSALTLPLSLAGKKSTVAYNDIIDHVVVSNEMNTWYMNATANILTDVTGLVSSFGSTTSDHYPVFTRYMFCKITPPADLTVSADSGKCGAVVHFNVGSTMTCGTLEFSHVSGSFFPVGTTTVNLTSSTGETASFNVTVEDKQAPLVTSPQSIVVNPASLSGAVVQYTVTASDNCSNTAPAVRQTGGLPSGDTFPIGTTVNTFEVMDASGNITFHSFSVTVRDPYCDNNKEDRKVFICFNGNTNCVSVHSLQPFLEKGGRLGKCDWYTTNNTSNITVQRKEDPSPVVAESFTLTAYPNPVGKTAIIRYTIPVAANVTIRVYDLAGREMGTLFRGERAAGTYQLSYDAVNLKAGIYYCRIVASANEKQWIQTQKLVRVK